MLMRAFGTACGRCIILSISKGEKRSEAFASSGVKVDVT